MIDNTVQADFERDGFINVHDVFQPSEIVDARNELERLYRDFPAGTAARLVPYHPDGIDAGQARIDHPHLVSPLVDSLLRAPTFSKAVRSILGVKTVQVWYCHALRKPGATDSANHVGWHQDGQYASFLTGSFITAWIPLVDIGADSSPLIYVSGSHRQGALNGSGFSHKATLEELKSSILSHNRVKWCETIATGPAGFVSFHHSDVLHGSAGNQGGGVRYSIACHLRTERNLLLPENDYKDAVSQIRDTELSPVICGSVDALDFGGVTA